MKNKMLFLGAMASVALLAGTASAGLNLVFNEPAGDIPDEVGGIDGFGDTHVIAGVDTDGDSNQEIIALRVNGSVEYAELYIYEYAGSDNAYSLVYSDRISTTGGPSGTGTFGNLLVEDFDGANGDEIIVFFSGASIPMTRNMHVYVNNGNDSWGAGNTAADDEFSQALLVDTEADGGAEVNGAFIADVDGDTTLELVIADDEDDNVSILTVSGVFGAGATLVMEQDIDIRNSTPALGGSAYEVGPADINGDGQPEIISISWNNFGVGVTESTAADTYVPVLDDNPGTLYANDVLAKPNTIQSIDFDGNGANSVLMLSQFHGDLLTFEGVASGSVASVASVVPTILLSGVTDLGATVQTASVTGGPRQLGQDFTVADIDNDGNPEILYTYNASLDSGRTTDLAILEYNSGPEGDLASYTLYSNEITQIAGDVIADIYAGSVGAPLDMDGDTLYEVVGAATGFGGPMIYVYEQVGPTSVSNWDILD